MITREREYEERKKNCRFFPVVLMKRLVFRLLSWTTKWTKNGLQWTKKDEDDDSEEVPSKQTTLRAFGTHTQDNADRGRAQKPGRLSNVPDMPRDLQSAV